MRRNKAKWPILLSLILVMSMLLTACSSKGGSTSTSGSGGNDQLADNQVLNIADSSDIPSLNWTQISDSTSSTYLQYVTSGLMRLNDKLEPQPDMAASMPEISKDKKTYTFKLRKDAKWSDGSPVTANDFVYAWRKMVDPKTASPYSFIFASANIKNAAKIENKKDPLFGKIDQLGVKALNDHTLQVTLDKPTPYFLSMLANAYFMPQKQSFVEKQGDKLGQEPQNLLYNGPFKLTKWDHGSGWTLEKNNDYWDAKHVYLKQVNVHVIKDNSTAVNMYNSGKLDATGLSSDFIDQFKNKKDQFHTFKDAGVFFLYLNQKRQPALKNVNVRKAINMSIDRNQMVNVLLKDGSVAANYIVPKEFAKGPDGKDFRSAAPNGYNGYNPKEAQKLWEKGKKELGIKSLKLELMSQDTSTSAKINEYIANQIEKNLPGVKVTVNKQPWGNYLKLLNSGKYDLGNSGWIPDYDDPMTYLDLWTTNNQQNNMGFSDPKFDKLIEEADNLGADPQKRWDKMHEAEKLLLEKDQAIAPLFQEGTAHAIRPYVKGLNYPNFGMRVDFLHAKILKH
ncbi:oligopeptide transport system substrate-binding protein [Scopulibacillus daqui]|uniref:Oligopeptide transport system substrate-binding protein n=1 Tax=Scopulibacillus daqui TaxID=1469162 RepID=A0ABS2PVE4_9BACL|nr:peptide ABC transporter substrate-binding protein [Scopulibacillus daqui]MBM7644022.1 oligopeptide transport system substrate-binding protein [Scopulibacillus daqui]